MEDKIKYFDKLTKEMSDLYKRKNHDYGDSVGQTYQDFGLVSFVVRILDKINRLKSLCKKQQQVKDESIRDTLMDIANYCLLAIIEEDFKNQK